MAVPSVPKSRVMTVAAEITEVPTPEGKEAVTLASPPCPSDSSAGALKVRVTTESSSTMVSVSGATAPPSPAVTVPLTTKVSGPSGMLSSVSVNPVRSAALEVVELAGMVISAPVPGAVKSVPPPVAETGFSAAAFTVTVVAVVRSETVAVVNRARTRTDGVSSSARVFWSPFSAPSVSAVKVIPKSLSAMGRYARLTAKPLSAVPPAPAPSTDRVSSPSARESSAMVRALKEVAEPLLRELPGMVTVIGAPGAVKSAASPVAVPSVPNDRVIAVAVVMSEVTAVEAKAAVTSAASAVESSEADVPKVRVITESSSVMVRGVVSTG